MANEEHLNILKQDTEIWNRWRQEYPDIIPNFSGATLPKTDLIGADLVNTDLVKGILVGTNLFAANLPAANLKGALLFKTNLSRANLSGADLRGTDFRDDNLRDIDLSGSNLSNAIFLGTVLCNIDLSKAQGLGTCKHFGQYHKTVSIS